MKWQSFWSDFVDLVFPRCCEACDSSLIGNESTICTTCRIGLPRVGNQNMHQNETIYLMDDRWPVLEVQSFLLFTKRGKVQKLLHALKYRGAKEVGIALGKMYGDEMLSAGNFPQVDLIVPVPLHPRKRRSRGFNQSDAIAEGIALSTAVPWSNQYLIRTKFTETQTGKGKLERRENVKNVFAVSGEMQAKKVLLIDDVLTTGATVEACVIALYESGCEEVFVRTIAVAKY